MNTLFFRRCPDDETFLRYFSGELGESERERFLGHSTRCPNCRLRLNVLSSVQAELETREKDIPEDSLSAEEERAFKKIAEGQVRTYSGKGRMSLSRGLRAAGLMAAGLVLVILGYRLFTQMSAIQPVMRGNSRPEIRLHQPEGKIKEAPKIFSWSKVKDAESYSLEIVRSDLSLVFSSSLPGTRFHLPEDIRQGLERQTSYLWTVSAYDDDNHELGSGSVYFEIE